MLMHKVDKEHKLTKLCYFEELVEIPIGEANQTYFQTKKITKENYGG